VSGVNVTRGEDAFGFLDYATRLSEGAQDHAVTGGLRVRY
jgi:hypothetical protein